MDIGSFEEWKHEAVLPGFEGRSIMLAPLEIKKKITSNALKESFGISSPDIVLCNIGDDTCRKYMPNELMGQVKHQCIVLQVPFCIYVVAAETDLMYKMVIRVPSAAQERFQRSIIHISTLLVNWAFSNEISLSDFILAEDKEEM